MSDWKPAEEQPLKGVRRCKKTDCAKQLHCFLKDRSRKTPEGTCLACGAALVDWPRVHRRDLHDVGHTIQALKYEHIRHEFWCTVALTERASTYARRRGRVGLLEAARTRIKTSVGKPAGPWDGRQTAWEDKGHAVHYAQHATATCCRKCIEVWHDIPRDQALSDGEVEYFAQLVLRYVIDRLPDLADGPVAIRKTRPHRVMRKAG